MNASPPKYLTGWFDGSSGRPGQNPRAGWILEDGNGLKLSGIVENAGLTSVTAEYHGLIGILKQLKETPPPARSKTYLQGDNRVVIEQVSGRWGVGQPHLEPLFEEAAGLIFDLEQLGIEVNLVWVPRNENKAHNILHPPKEPAPTGNGRPKRKTKPTQEQLLDEAITRLDASDPVFNQVFSQLAALDADQN